MPDVVYYRKGNELIYLNQTQLIYGRNNKSDSEIN